MGKGRSKVDLESVFCFGFVSVEGSVDVFCLLLGSRGVVSYSGGGKEVHCQFGSCYLIPIVG